MNRSTSARNLLLALFIPVVIGALYWPVVQAKYAAIDDFPTFFPVDDEIPEIYRADGRPGLDLLLKAVEGHIDRIEDLSWLRAISVLGIGLLCVVLFVASRRLIPSPEFRWSTALSIGGLPTLVVFAAWTCVWCYSWGAMLAVVAGCLCWRGCRIAATFSVSKALPLWAASTLLMVLILLTYQPLVSWYWIVGLLVVLDQRFVRFQFYRRACAWFAGVGVGQLACCFVALKAYFWLTGIEPKSRVQLLSDPVAKITALGRTTLTMVLDLWQVVDVNRKPLMLAIAAITAIVIVAGLIAAWKRPTNGRQPAKKLRLFWLAAIVLCLAMSHVHGLAVDVNVKNYRTIGALAVCVVILLAFSLQQLAQLIDSAERRQRLLRGLSVVLLAISLGMARVNLTHYWTTPYSQGFAYLVEQLDTRLTPNTQRIHLIRQTEDDGITTQRTIYSFGRPISEPPWVMPGLLLAALKELPEQPKIPIENLTASFDPDEAPAGEDVLVIDMRELVKFRNDNPRGDNQD